MASGDFTPPNDVHQAGPLFSMVPHELLAQGLSATAIAVYAHLARYADWRTGLAHPSRKKLMEHLGYKSYKPIDDAVKELQQTGWVGVCQRWVKHENGSTVSRLGTKPGKEWAQSSNGYVVMRGRWEYPAGFPVVDRGYRPQSTPPVDHSQHPLLTPVDTNENQENENQENEKEYDQRSVDHEPAKATGYQNDTSRRNTYPAEFEEWWATYPRKVGKGKAVKDWRRAMKRTDNHTLINASRRLAAFHAAEGTDPRFIPHPSTWLNRDGWDDDLTPSKPRGSAMDNNTIEAWLGETNTDWSNFLPGSVIDAEYWETDTKEISN